jgi:hypothetical protein
MGQNVRSQCCPSSWLAPGSSRQGAAQDHLIDSIRFDAAPTQRLSQGVGSQFGRSKSLQPPPEGAKGSPGCGKDEGRQWLSITG